MKSFYIALLFACLNLFSQDKTEEEKKMNYNHILQITKIGNPILRQISEEVTNIFSPEIKSIIRDMKSTFEDLNNTAVGLAAPQVNFPVKIIIIQIPKIESENFDGFPLTVMINPKFTPLSEEKVINYEACLSLPGLRGKVSRYKEISYSYQDEEGKIINGTAKGYFAKVIQHEYDHLIGKLYIDRMEDLSTLGYGKEIKKVKSK